MDKNKQQKISSGLYLVSTPIGNLEDITHRALNVLKNSDIILCEDTRRSAKLLYHFNIKNKLLAYHKFNEEKVSNKIIDHIKNNCVVSLITDAGTPTISDPGMILINKCIDEKLDIYPIPGPSAVTSAVSISGFNEKYLFYGFLSKKKSQMENAFKSLKDLDYSIVFFIPAIKINFYLEKFKIFFPDRKMVIAREMTKIHEEFIRGNVLSMKNLSEHLKGELTVVLSQKIVTKKVKKELSESVKIEIKKMLKKYSHKDVVELICKKENMPKKIVYNFCLKQINKK